MPDDDTAERIGAENRCGPLLPDLVTNSSLRNPALVLIGGLLLVLAVAGAGLLLGNPYFHDVSKAVSTPDGSPEDNNRYYRYEELSPTAQELFTQALHAEEPIRTGTQAPEFDYHEGGNIYPVEYQGETYVMEVQQKPKNSQQLIVLCIGAVGAGMMVYGSVRFH